MQSRDPYYRMAPGASVVPLPDGRVLLRSEIAAVRLEGKAAMFFVHRVLPLLTRHRSLSEISGAVSGTDAEDLRTHLDHLVERGLLRRHETLQDGADEPRPGYLFEFLEDLGIAPAEARERLSRLAVAVVGLEGHGAHVAWNLASAGVGRLILLDPYPCVPADLDLMPPLGASAVGKSRHEALRAALSPAAGTRIVTVGDGPLTKEDVQRVAAEVQLIVGCFDKGFSATNVWINEAALLRNIGSLYAEIRGSLARIGPLVLPGQTACYMCWRMRALACADDFEEAMAYEEFLDRQRRPALHERSLLPFLPAFIGSVVGSQILTSMLEVSIPALAGKVFEYNGLTLQGRFHTVLQQPDCPVCRRTGRSAPLPPSQPGSAPIPPGDIEAAAPSLVSPVSGIVRDMRPMPKDVSEPEAPFVFRAQLANHRFLEHPGDELIAAGKGMTEGEALRSALGEAVERYSASCWNPATATYARRGDLPGESVDPRALVLYRPEQYRDLSYAPYREETRLGWIPARSLVTGHAVHVPALAVNMAYQVCSPEEYLFGPTSNGLAAGPTRDDATLSGLLEVIERDAFVISWINRLPSLAVDLATHPMEEIRALSRSYQRRQIALHVSRLAVDHPVHVMLALAIDGRRREPAVVVGLGADLNPAVAAKKAVLEVGQVRPALKMRLRDPKTRARLGALLEDPERVSALDDHDLLYAAPAMVSAFDFLIASRPAATDWEADAQGEPVVASTIDRLARVVDHFRRTGADVLVYDLTPPDMLRLGLHTVRVIVPDFQPIDFGWKERRLGGTRLYQLPHRLGLLPEPPMPANLNGLPHPLA